MAWTAIGLRAGSRAGSRVGPISARFRIWFAQSSRIDMPLKLRPSRAPESLPIARPSPLDTAALPLALALALAPGLVSCTADDVLFGDGTDKNNNESVDSSFAGVGGASVEVGVGGNDGTGGSGASGCVPGNERNCYDGPADTQGIGSCSAGVESCSSDGTWGPCLGQIVPSEELCVTPGDDDCDGAVNEDGVDCACAPGTNAECYSGPAATKNVGNCKAGAQTCLPDGSGYGACKGELLPAEESCATAADEDCDGQTPACPAAIVDLRADNNRNGKIDLAEPSEDNAESTWDATHGAIFLANIDDDASVCPSTGTDAALAACNDAADNVINGTDDLLDLARLQIAPWPSANAGASGSVSVASPGSKFVRLFKKAGGAWSEYVPGASLSASELKSGVELAIEGKDFVRDSASWNGFVDVTLTVNGGDVMGGTDTVRMRVAPVVFRHHLDPLTTYYVTSFNSTASTLFRDDLADAAGAAKVGVHEVFEADQWTQDFFETAYMAMPSVLGKQALHVNFRSANYASGKLRTAGRVVFTDFQGKDIAGAVVYDPNHSDSMDTLNSFGNTETIPPYTHNGKAWPLGRVLRGSHASFYPDKAFDKLITSNSVQGLVTIDTSWLLVGHVDETVSFVKANSPRGWVMLANDAALAKQLLEQQQKDGNGQKQMFVGKFWSTNVSAAITISKVLADPDIMNESAWAAVKVGEQVAALKAETGLTDAEIVDVPYLHWAQSGYSVAFNPGTVNGIYMSDSVFATPEPHGPLINNVDIFKSQLTQALSPYGVTVYWVENWDLYHRLLGEVHCGTNATRAVPKTVHWWESGK
ncbi:MAG: hypothetical protein EXR75_03360 [Myxococcales bacterium]|nr:hypothetical protein [Myxococcales bacterium]